jgi:MFS transporter, DHA1 family, multidrug resistance protein
LLERFGRKRPLYFGLTLYLLASIGCALATSVDALIMFRLVQALGSCVGMVASRAIVRDLFEVHQNAKIFSLLMLVVAVSPIVAPTAGGYVTAAFGWRWVFAVLIFLDILILVGVYFLLPESKQPDPNFSLRPKPITKSFLSILRHPQFYIYALTGAIAYGGLSAYVSGSPDVFMGLFRVAEKQYGWIFALIALGIISASQFNNIALKKYSSKQIVRTATMSQTVIGVAFAALTIVGWTELYSTIFFIFLFLGCQGFIFPNASALSLAAFGHNAGSASALLGAIQMGVGAAASAIVSILQNNTMLPMAGIMAVCAVTAFAVFHLGKKAVVQQADKEKIEEEDVDMITTL